MTAEALAVLGVTARAWHPNDYSDRPAREQYQAARWFKRCRHGFVAAPNGVPDRVWAAVPLRGDGQPVDPLRRTLLERAVHGGWWAAQNDVPAVRDAGLRRYFIGPRSAAVARVIHQRRAAARRSGLFIEFQTWS